MRRCQVRTRHHRRHCTQQSISGSFTADYLLQLLDHLRVETYRPMKNPMTRLVSHFRNIVWRGSSKLTLEISGDDIVVFVVGPTGSGKSWFTREATRSDLVKTSRTNHPATKEVQAIRCELTEEAKSELLQNEGVKNIVFIDTPSFLTGCDHPDAQEEFKKWRKRTRYEPRPEHVGVVYIHRLETDPVLEPLSKHLKEFVDILRIGNCDMPQQLLIVGSYDKTSSVVSSSKIDERIATLDAQLEKLDTPGGKASMHKELFQGQPEVAWNVVAELFK